MIITYHGDNYFKIQSGSVSVLVDPTNQRSFKGATLILNTTKPASTDEPSDDQGVSWIDHQGEFEIQGIEVSGWSVGYEDGVEKTAFSLTLEGITVTVLGHLKKELLPELYEKFNGSDILIIPGGGRPWISPEIASKLIRQIEPGIIIPSLYKKDLKPFLKEFDGESPKLQEKLVIKKKDISPKDMTVECLKVK